MCSSLCDANDTRAPIGLKLYLISNQNPNLNIQAAHVGVQLSLWCKRYGSSHWSLCPREWLAVMRSLEFGILFFVTFITYSWLASCETWRKPETTAHRKLLVIALCDPWVGQVFTRASLTTRLRIHYFIHISRWNSLGEAMEYREHFLKIEPGPFWWIYFYQWPAQTVLNMVPLYRCWYSPSESSRCISLSPYRIEFEFAKVANFSSMRAFLLILLRILLVILPFTCLILIHVVMQLSKRGC